MVLFRKSKRRAVALTGDCRLYLVSIRKNDLAEAFPPRRSPLAIETTRNGTPVVCNTSGEFPTVASNCLDRGADCPVEKLGSNGNAKRAE